MFPFPEGFCALTLGVRSGWVNGGVAWWDAEEVELRNRPCPPPILAKRDFTTSSRNVKSSEYFSVWLRVGEDEMVGG